MFAVTQTGFRAVAAGDVLMPGEVLAGEVPADLLALVDASAHRQVRSQLLRDTDWTQMADAPLTPAQRAAMAAYRQALRDLPEQPGFPDCQWPQPPALGEGAASAGTSTFP